MMFKAILACAALTCAVASAVLAQEDVGRAEYVVACAGCHGESGKGGGPWSEMLNLEPPALTQMAANNGGEFPFEYAVWMIDGRESIRLHGPADMPIWGDRFMVSAELTERASEPPETWVLTVRGRILSLVYYLDSIQE